MKPNLAPKRLVTTRKEPPITFAPAPAYPPFKGVDWSHATHRHGCQDHLKWPSRRGDVLVEHGAKLIHMVSKVK